MKPGSEDVIPSRRPQARWKGRTHSFARRTGVALLVTGLMAAGQAAHAMPVAGPSAARPASHVVTLVTGERVLVGTAAGRSTVRVIRSAQQGVGAHVLTATVNGAQYVIPASAQPYLGRYLDPSLFDVTKLAAAAHADRTPLRISFTP